MIPGSCPVRFIATSQCLGSYACHADKLTKVPRTHPSAPAMHHHLPFPGFAHSSVNDSFWALDPLNEIRSDRLLLSFLFIVCPYLYLFFIIIEQGIFTTLRICPCKYSPGDRTSTAQRSLRRRKNLQGWCPCRKPAIFRWHENEPVSRWSSHQWLMRYQTEPSVARSYHCGMILRPRGGRCAGFRQGHSPIQYTLVNFRCRGNWQKIFSVIPAMRTYGILVTRNFLQW